MSRYGLAVILGGFIVGLGTACAPVPVTEAPVPTRCDAEASRSLIGTHIGAVTFPRDANVRLVCTACAATMDHDPDRLNLRYDEATGIIKAVDCG